MHKKISSAVGLVLLFVFLPRAMDVAVFSIRLYGGGTYLQGGDLNSGLKGWTDFYKAYYGTYGYPQQTGSFNPVHLGFHGGGDLIFHLTERFGIGLGAEYLMATKSSTMTFQSTNTSMTWKILGKPSAVQAKASLFYFVPLGKSVSVSLHAGVSYYWAQTRLESHSASEGTTIDYIIDSSAKGVGYHGGLGLEWNLSSSLSFLIEGGARYAVLSKFDGSVTMVGLGGWNGRLYYWGATTSFLNNYNYIDLLIAAPGGPGFTFVREAKIDFGGFSLRAGFVLKL
jgi:hypothetical protein